ncbi:MAG: VCBS repeat-containing protein, partial [Deltaproteobacteria bacterium]|nr:VCBS repeat-containing protein [Deltaproteobacteria bacterium]
MRQLALIVTCSAFALGTLGTTASAADNVLHTFAKSRLSDQFFSEGAAFGDFNQDGVGDVASGPYWYAGPDFTKKSIIYQPKPFDPKGYSDNFFAYTYDFNGDKRDDVLVLGFPGKDASWFENPGNDMQWKRHQVFNVVDNESPEFTDVVGDKKPELLCTTEGFIGYATVDWKDPAKPWTFHKISEKGGWHKFTHGMGVGDINGDGRNDIIMQDSWWEQPASLAGDPLWTRHKADFGRGGAQMLVYDVDGDKKNDVITSLEAHEWGLAWHQQQADGSFKRHLVIGDKEEQSPYGVKFSQMHALALVDIDGDGLKDVVTGKRYWAHGPGGDPEPNAAAVLYWFGLKRSAQGVVYVPHQIDGDSGVGTQLPIGDVNGDKLPDIIIGNKK